jgi:hypothetical protein
MLLEYLEDDKNVVVENLDLLCLKQGKWLDIGQKKSFLTNQIDMGRKIVFWTKENAEFFLPGEFDHKFVGFENLLGKHYDSNHWCVTTPSVMLKPYKNHFTNYDNWAENFWLEEHQVDHPNSKPFSLLFLTGSDQTHRCLMLNSLNAELLENSLWSFNKLQSDSLGPRCVKTIPAEYEWPEYADKQFAGKSMLSKKPYWPQYRDTVLSLVTETLVSDQLIYTSEKTFKPILSKHVFVILGSVGILENLKSIGFKTFDKIFDESYDRIEDLKEKIDAISKLVSQIANMDSKKLYDQTKSIRDHNYNLIKDQKHFRALDKGTYERIKRYLT